MMKLRFFLILCLMICLVPVMLTAQKKDLTLDDYDQWQRLGGLTVSDDASWGAYTISLVDGDGWMVLRNMQNSAEDTFKVSSSPQFSKDAKWFSFRIDYKLGLMNLATSKIDTFENIITGSFNDDGTVFVMKKYKGEGVKTAGTDLLVKNLTTGDMYPYGNVSAHSFNETGTHLAMTIDASEKLGNGVHLINLSDMSLKVLDIETAKYGNMTWNDDGDGLAVFREVENDDYEGTTHTIVAFLDVTNKNYKKY
ncbi:hypothetical protein ACFL67_03080, partial [candidate division KSB1 bacterium]